MSKEELYEMLYNITNGTVVELVARHQMYTGDFFLLRQGSSYSDEDEVTLENPVELPSGKQRNTLIKFPVKEVQKVRVISIGMFNKKREADDMVIPVVAQTKPTPGNKGTIKSQQPNSKSNKVNTLLKNNMKSGITSEYHTSKDTEAVELQLKTFVIKDETELNILIKLMKDVDIVGITLEGHDVGRFGRVPWVVMTARKTLLPFNIEKLTETVPDIWRILEKSIFSNDKLIKIMHDSRLAADYLFHRHQIQIFNLFDTQVADIYIKHQCIGVTPEKYDPLSDCLQLYNRRIPHEEIDFLRLYEKYNVSNSVKWLEKPLPPPECLKAAAIKVKHLIPLRENMLSRMMEPYSKLVETHMETVKGKPNETGYPEVTLDVSKDVLSALE